MRNLKTHMWLCIALGGFHLIAVVVIYFVLSEISQNASGFYLPSELILIGIVDMSLYSVYLLFVLFKAIKYTPSTAKIA